MGGKTQQRLAGNAKPTNSGRIRGLLVSQQLATNNVITFSALSAKSKQNKPLETKAPIEGEEKKNSPKAGPMSENSTEAEADPSPHTNYSTSTKDNTRLVLKRVGNRELYTRVRLTDDEALQESAVELSIAGVKKPSNMATSTNAIYENDNHQESGTILEQNDPEQDKAAPADIGFEKAKEEEDGDPDDKLQFDDLLDRLQQTMVLVEQSSHIGNLHELDETTSEHEVRLLATFKILIRKFSDELSIEDWDLIVSSLNKWVRWVSKSDHPLKEYHQANLCAEVFTFIHQLIVHAQRLQQETHDPDENPMAQSLLDDWANFKSSRMFLDLIALYLKLIKADQMDQTIESNPTLKPMVEALAHIIITVDASVVLTHPELLEYLDTRVEFDPDIETPKNSIFCSLDEKKFKTFQAVFGLLRSNSRVILITAHRILNKVVGPVCENAQSATLMADHEAVDDVLIFPPTPFMALLISRDSIMATLLSDYRAGDISVTMEPNTDAYACTLAYLFAWDLTIQFIVGAGKEIGQCMIHSLKKLGLLQRLLDTIFMLLPPLDDRNLLHLQFESSDRTEIGGTQSWCMKQFLRSPLKTSIKRPVNEVELIALHLYFSVALHMPVTVRKWYNNNSNKRLGNLVNEYTVKHISQLICSIEMDSVQEECQKRANLDESNNLTIKARPTAKEVYAIYTRDEFKMELTIKLPHNYPLGSVQIDGGKRVGVTDVKWRSWLLQLTTFLAHQNGPILDGIDLWRKNIDKRFEGVEKCTICFSILHSNYQLPKKKCQTCANIFHNVCLYKWFESSGNSTCPLCRNPW